MASSGHTAASHAASSHSPSSPAAFSRERHVKYHLRCLKTLLPTVYTSNDSNRMLLAFFTVSALDLLSALTTNTTADERASFADWLYRCQLPSGGFRSFPGTDFGTDRRNSSNEHWDPANVAGTYFALQLLLLLGDDLLKVKRREALVWLKSLQLNDGSFGEVLGADGRPAGERDVRYCYMATAIRHMLRTEADEGHVEDVDVERLAQFVLASQTYEGGFGKAAFHESHAGWTYCGVATLAMLDRIPRSRSGGDEVKRRSHVDEQQQQRGHFMSDENLLALSHWLASRQTPYGTNEVDDDDGDDDDEEEEEEEEEEAEEKEEEEGNQQRQRSFQVLRSSPASQPAPKGFNGRCNKPLDTCYFFWTTAALDILGQKQFLDLEANRRFLLGKTQHLIGGFSKLAGDPPDIMHSSLALAGLALTADSTRDGLKTLDPTLCISVQARERLEGLSWRRRVER